MKPVENDEPDPILDPRPMHSSATGSGSEESSVLHTANRLTERRPSGVMPQGYQQNLKYDISKLQENVMKIKKTNGIIQKAEDSIRPHSKNSASTSSKVKLNINDDVFKALREKLAGIEEDEDDDENDKTVEIAEKDNTDEIEDSSESESSISDDQPALSSKINKDCFICKKMTVKSLNDAYNLKSEDIEKRLYLSSERYRQTFEDDFPEFLKAVNKTHLNDDIVVEQSSIITSEMYRNSVSRTVP